MATERDELAEAREAFKLASEAENDNRLQAMDDLRFARLGEQWPDKIKTQRELDGRACLTFNRMPTFIRQVVNDARMNRPAMRVHPVGSDSDIKTAKILDGLIRNIEVTSDADIAYDTGIDYAVTTGVGYIRVNVDYACDDTFDQDILIQRVANPFSVYGDPFSTAADSSDWNSAFITDWLTVEQFELQYPKADKIDFDADHMRDAAEWFADKRVLVAEYWTREQVAATLIKLSTGAVLLDDQLPEELRAALGMGAIEVVGTRDTMTYKVKQRLMNGGQVLDTVDWVGKYIPIVPVYGDEFVIDGKRYWQSLIRHSKDAQRNYNYWRTSAVEKVALDVKAPYIGRRGTFDKDLEKWMSANVKNHAFIEYDGPEAPQRQFGGGVPAGDLAMAAHASDDMKAIIGIYDASLGARSNETSGVAIRQRQKEGDVSTFHFIDNLSRAIRHTGRILVDLIPKVYNTERVVRILGEDGQPADTVPGQRPGMVPINQPIVVEGVETIFDLANGKYDVTVKAGPSFSTRREESSAQMMEMIRGNPGLMQVIGDLVAESLDWPGADKIAERLRNMLPPQAIGQQQNPQMQQAQMQMQQMQQALQQGQKAHEEAMRKVYELEMQLKDKSEENAIKAREVEVKARDSETNRLKTWAELNRPPEPQRAAQQAGPEPVF